MRAERGLLADLLWSDRSEAQARASLRQELSVLRKALPQGLLNADRQAVWLDPSQVCLVRGSGEFLKGFDLASEGFEDWLRERRGATPAAPGIAGRTGERPVLAVLPFEELDGAGEDFFADGVVEEITSALSRVRDFHVIARQSAFALRGQVLDIPAIAEKLGADYLVEGTIRRAGGQVRISVQLVRGKDGHTLWTERFDDRLDDLFDLQDRIAAQVAGQVSPSLRSAEIARAESLATEHRTAYSLTLSALPHFWAHRKGENARAIAILDEALAKSPDYGPALAYKAWALAQQPSYMWSDDPAADHAVSISLAESAAERVTDHVPSLVAIGAALTLSSPDIGLARSFVERALAIDPNNAWGWMRLGWIAIYEKSPEEAARHFDRAEMLSPLDPFRFNVILGRSVTRRLLGDTDDSVRLIRAGMRANPGITWAYRMLAGDLTLAGREEEAQEAVREFRRHYPHVTLAYLRACWPPAIVSSQPEYYQAFRRAGLLEK